MVQYIPKSALVAEIERRITEVEKMAKTISSSAIMGLIQAYKNTLSSINTFETLEVKEVDLETQIEDYINSHFTEGCDGGMISDWYKVLGGVHYRDLVEIAKHFFELGIKAKEK